MIYRYIYKITCTAGSFNNKFYFGQHTTEDLNDGYNGCGILLGKYYKKYPDDYIKEIIAFYDTQEELNQAEYDIIHPWLGNEMCLNLCEGGKGGPMFKGHQHSEESKKKTTASLYRYYETHEGPNKGKKMSEETKLKHSISSKGRPIWNKGITGYHNKPCSEERKMKISEAKRGKKRTIIDGKIRYV